MNFNYQIRRTSKNSGGTFITILLLVFKLCGKMNTLISIENNLCGETLHQIFKSHISLKKLSIYYEKNFQQFQISKIAQNELK